VYLVLRDDRLWSLFYSPPKRWLVSEGLDSLEDEPDLFVVVVAVAGGAEVAGGGDALTGGFVG
jgi:hypothetical protein